MRSPRRRAPRGRWADRVNPPSTGDHYRDRPAFKCGPLCALLVQARDLTVDRPELDLARYFLDAALLQVRRDHHRGHPNRQTDGTG